MLRPAILAIVLITLPCTLPAQEPVSTQEGPVTTTPDITPHPRTPDDSTLTNDAVVRMARAGLSEQIIAQAVQLQPGRYETGAQDLIALKQAGVSDKVISLMQAHGTGLTIRGGTGNSAASATGAKPVQVTPLSPGIDEMGVYYQDKSGEWTPLKTERVVIKSGGWIKSAVTDGLIKADRNGTVDGEHSSLVLEPGMQILIYAPEGTAAYEYTFLQFREHGNRREFRVYTGGVFHGQSGSDRDAIDFKAQKVGTRMYTFAIPEDVVVGEYGVLPPGPASAPGLNGNGKMYTFRIAEGHATKKP